MSLIPNDATKIEVNGATVDFFELAKDGISTYYFDSSKCGPPEPMVNAMSGLKLIKGTNNQLVMINHKSPGGLFAKLGDDISHEVVELDGFMKITFSTNIDSTSNTDLNQDTCH